MKYIIVGLAVALSAALILLRGAYVDIGEARQECETRFAEYRAEVAEVRNSIIREYEQRMAAQQADFERAIRAIEDDKRALETRLTDLNDEITVMESQLTEEQQLWADTLVPKPFLDW